MRITNDNFHSRVIEILPDIVSSATLSNDSAVPIPTISALTPSDTSLGPEEFVPRLLGIVSPWIDLCSPNPVVYSISRQVLQMEVSFAAFCGLSALVLPVPRLHHEAVQGHCISQYAHAVREVLETGLYIQFSVTLPMWDDPAHFHEAEGSLAGLTSPGERGTGASMDSSMHHDFFGTWDAWNEIRSLCKYNSRLMVGKSCVLHSSPLRFM